MKRIVSTACLCAALAFGVSAAVSAADGKQLYSRCAGCHGADGSKAAMNVAKPLKGMNAADFTKAMSGYRAKTYGGAKKGMMEGVAATLSDADIKALADYTTKF